jgi:hypothetical protein
VFIFILVVMMTTSNIRHLPSALVETKEILEDVVKQQDNIKSIVIVAKTKDGKDMYWSTSAEKAQICYQVTTFLHRLLNGDFDA